MTALKVYGDGLKIPVGKRRLPLTQRTKHSKTTPDGDKPQTFSLICKESGTVGFLLLQFEQFEACSLTAAAAQLITSAEERILMAGRIITRGPRAMHVTAEGDTPGPV